MDISQLIQTSIASELDDDDDDDDDDLPLPLFPQIPRTPPSSIPPSIPNKPKPPKETRSHTLQEIIEEFGPANKVEFEPFIPEPYQMAQPILPRSFPNNPQALDYFSLFFTAELWQTVTRNTNTYARI